MQKIKPYLWPCLVALLFSLAIGCLGSKPIQLRVWFVSSAAVAVVVFAFWGLSGEARRIHGELDRMHNLAKGAVTRSALLALRSDLVAYAKKECWHRHLGSHAREVCSYIDGRLNAIEAGNLKQS